MLFEKGTRFNSEKKVEYSAVKMCKVPDEQEDNFFMLQKKNPT